MEFNPYLLNRESGGQIHFLRNLSSSSANICIQALLLKILIKAGDRPWSCGAAGMRSPLRDDKNRGRLITVYREQVSTKLVRKRIQLLISTLQEINSKQITETRSRTSMKRSVTD